jgi:hypothetical protein
LAAFPVGKAIEFDLVIQEEEGGPGMGSTSEHQYVRLRVYNISYWHQSIRIVMSALLDKG